MMRYLSKSVLAIVMVLGIFLTLQLPAKAEVFRKNFDNGQNSLIVEILDEDLAHFEFSTLANRSSGPIYT